MQRAIKLKVRPLTVNQCWQGRRYKTNKYNQYEKMVMECLPASISIPDNEKLRLYLEFGVSTKLADWDNPIKPFQDVLQKKYDFNDNRIYEATVKKVVVKKGEEYVKFRIY